MRKTYPISHHHHLSTLVLLVVLLVLSSSPNYIPQVYASVSTKPSKSCECDVCPCPETTKEKSSSSDVGTNSESSATTSGHVAQDPELDTKEFSLTNNHNIRAKSSSSSSSIKSKRKKSSIIKPSISMTTLSFSSSLSDSNTPTSHKLSQKWNEIQQQQYREQYYSHNVNDENESKNKELKDDGSQQVETLIRYYTPLERKLLGLDVDEDKLQPSTTQHPEIITLTSVSTNTTASSASISLQKIQQVGYIALSILTIGSIGYGLSYLLTPSQTQQLSILPHKLFPTMFAAPAPPPSFFSWMWSSMDVALSSILPISFFQQAYRVIEPNIPSYNQVETYVKEKVLPMAYPTFERIVLMELWRNVWSVVFSELNDVVSFLARPFCIWRTSTTDDTPSDMDSQVMEQLKSCTILLWGKITPSWLRRGLQKTFMKIVERNVEKAVRGYASTVQSNVFESVRTTGDIGGFSNSNGGDSGSDGTKNSGMVVSWFFSWFGKSEDVDLGIIGSSDSVEDVMDSVKVE